MSGIAGRKRMMNAERRNGRPTTFGGGMTRMNNAFAACRMNFGG